MTGNDQSTSLFTAGAKTLRASIIGLVIRAVLGAAAAVVVGSLVDGLIGGRSQTETLVLLGVILGLRSLPSAATPLAGSITATSVESDLRRRVLGSILAAGPWTGRRTGETVNKAVAGVEAVGALAGTFLPQLIAGMSIPILLVLVVAAIDLPTALILLTAIPLVPVLLRELEKRFASVSDRYRASANVLAARFLDGIQGLRTLKTLGRADDYGDRIADDAERLRSETMGLLRVNQLALLAVDTLFTLGTVVAAAAMAAVRLGASAITVGQAVTIVLLGVMLIEPLGQIGRYFYVGASGRAAVGQIRELLQLSNPAPPAGPPSREVRAGGIVFSGVSYTYPEGGEGVSDITFEIDPGETVALVGPSGAGKTTIAHLLLRLLHPDDGTVSVGGRAVLVPQRPFLFHGSVADNLRIARPDADDSELWAALESADLAGTVSSRPRGLDTQVGERGVQLSGGEVQRLAIARAMLVDAPVVVLDEPTSNVDLESEARLRVAIGRMTRDRTLFVIAHRRSTIAGVDRALLIEEGRLQAVLTAGEVSERFLAEEVTS